MKLEFGCGDQLTPGYTGVDLRKLPGIKYVCNAWEIDKKVKPNTVEAIKSNHFLEHLSFPQVDMVLRSWHKILKKGGKVITVVPELTYHIRQFLEEDRSKPSKANARWTLEQHALAGFYGWQREASTKMWDIHKSGYDESILRSYFERHGYVNIERIEDRPWNLHMVAYK